MPKGSSGARVGHLSEAQLEASMTEDFMMAIESYTEGDFGDRRRGWQANEINKAIEDNPSLRWSGGALYRGMYLTDGELTALAVGTTTDMRGFSSWTSSEHAAKDILNSKDWREAVEIVRGIKNLNKVMVVEDSTRQKMAISVRAISPMQWQDEVLYSGKSQFVVSNVQTRGDITYISVREQ